MWRLLLFLLALPAVAGLPEAAEKQDWQAVESQLAA